MCLTVSYGKSPSLLPSPLARLSLRPFPPHSGSLRPPPRDDRSPMVPVPRAACPAQPMRSCPLASIVQELSLKQPLSLQPLLLLLIPLRSPDAPFLDGTGMYRREKGKGELPDSQSRAVMGMEEYEAADVIQVSEYTSELLR